VPTAELVPAIDNNQGKIDAASASVCHPEAIGAAERRVHILLEENDRLFRKFSSQLIDRLTGGCAQRSGRPVEALENHEPVPLRPGAVKSEKAYREGDEKTDVGPSVAASPHDPPRAGPPLDD